MPKKPTASDAVVEVSDLVQQVAQLSETIVSLEAQLAERERTVVALQQYTERLGILHQIDQAILTVQSPEAIAQVALKHIRQLIPCQYSSLALFNFGTQEATVLAVSQPGKSRLVPGVRVPLTGFGNIAELEQGQPIVEDISTLESLSYIDQWLLEAGMSSRIHAPLVSHEQLIGCLSLAADTPDIFTVEHPAIAYEVATQLAVALENAQLHAETRRRTQQLAALNNASRAMASTLELEVVLRQTMAEVKTILNAEGASVLLHDQASNELFFATVVPPDAEILAGMRLPLTEGIAGWVMQERQAVLVDDVQRDPRFYDRIDIVTGLTTKSLLAVPLVYKDDVIGVVEVINKGEEKFNKHDLDMLEALAGAAAIAIENARLYKDLQDRMQTLQETQSQLIQSEKMAALGRLIASIAHEINNPLQSVQTCLALTKEELAAEKRQEKLDRYLDIVESEIDRVSGIIRRMRDFYRPAANQGMQPINVHELLEGVLALTNKQLQHSRITIERRWSQHVPKIRANGDHLKQVFLNLVLNAIDAMPEGGTLHLSTGKSQIRPDNGQKAIPAVRLQFSDTGQGMTQEALDHLFEPFFTTKPHGSGLGLCISYSIIEAHEGQIKVASEMGLGTTLTILLPVELPQPGKRSVREE